MNPVVPRDGEAGLLQTGDLLTRARAADLEARDILFTRYWDPLKRFLHARVPRGARGLLDTEDIVQEVSARAFATLAEFEYRGVGSFWSYLRRIGLNYVVQISRRRDVADPTHELLDDAPTTPAAAGVTPFEALVGKEEFLAFERALEPLGAKSREALLMRIELGLDYDAIAAECGFATTGAARKAISRAAERIAREIVRARHAH